MWVNHLMYANDLTLMSPSAKGLQKLLDICHLYAKETDMLFITEKSVCLYFECTKQKLHAVPYLVLDVRSPEYKETHKRLGVVIESSDSDNGDIAHQVRGLYFHANMMLCKFSLCTYR